MRRRMITRRFVRYGGGSVALVALATAAYLSIPAPSRPAAPAVHFSAEASPPITMTRFVETDLAITERVAAPTIVSTIRVLSDEQLQSLLAQTGDTGLVRTRGRVWLSSDIEPEQPAKTRPNSSS
jgi:hypothetical protein